MSETDLALRTDEIVTGKVGNDDSAAKTLIEQAREERERIEKATADLKKQNEISERIQAQMILGGRGFAGSPNVVKTPQELADEEAADLIKKFR